VPSVRERKFGSSSNSKHRQLLTRKLSRVADATAGNQHTVKAGVIASMQRRKSVHAFPNAVILSTNASNPTDIGQARPRGGG
jgi:hypothetical protein